MSVKPVTTNTNEPSGEGPKFDDLLQLSLKAESGTQDKPERKATDNEKWPPADKTEVDKPANGSVRYVHDGQAVVVERKVNPKLYDFLVSLHTLKSSDQSGAFDKAVGDKYTVATNETKEQSWSYYKEISWEGDAKDAKVLTYVSEKGEKAVVSKDLTPELFETVLQMGQSKQALQERKDAGREVADAKTYIAEHDITSFGWPDEFNRDIIQFDTRDGKQYVVSRHENRELYERVVEKRESYDSHQGRFSSDRNRRDFKIPELAELDLLSQKTGETDGKSNLTVNELATKNLLDHYKKLVKEGTVAKDSDIAKLIMAIEAKTAMDSGRGITPYSETTRPSGTTWREFGDHTQLTEADIQDILNGDSVDKALNDLFTSGNGEKDKISVEYQAELEKAIGKISDEDKKGLADRTYDTLTSLEYVKYLEQMKKDGLGTEAQGEVAALLSSLELLDKDRAAKAEATLQQNSIMAQIDALVSDPQGVPPEYQELALKDMGALIKSILKSADIPRRVQESVEKFIEEFVNKKDKHSLTELNELNEQRANGTITQEQFDQQMTAKYKPAEMSDTDWVKVSGTLNQYGVWGTLSAFGSLGGAIYMLSAKNGQLSDEPLERAAIAKDIISFIGAGAQFEKTKIANLFTDTNLAEYLGLSKSLPEIWNRESGSLGKWVEAKLRERGYPGVRDLPEEARAATPPLVPEALQDRANSLIELGSMRAGGGTGDVIDQVRISGEASGLATLDSDASRELLNSIVERAGGTPPDDYSRHPSLNSIASEQGLEITEEIINEVINEHRAANGLGDVPNDEALREFADNLETAASKPLPPSIASTSADSYYDAVISVYEEYFKDNDVEPPSRASFDQVMEDRQQSGRTSPTGTDPFDGFSGDFTVDREDLEEMHRLDNRPPPPEAELDRILPVVNETARNSASPANSLINAETVGSVMPETKTSPVPGTSAKIAGSLVKVLGVAPDLLGVVDIVMGAKTLKDAKAEGSDLGVAKAALEFTGGGASVLAGLVGTAGLFSSIGAVGGLTGPLFLLSATAGIIAGIVGIFVDHEKKQKATNKEGDWFEDLSKFGFTQEDWGDKLEYARYSFHEYGGRPAPNDESVFDYQQDEWNHFRNTPGEDGSSNNRLDKDKRKEKFDRAFYQENREVIHFIRDKWDDWNGDDDKVSIKDLEKISLKTDSLEEEKAVRWLLNNQELIDQLDTQWGKGDKDGKISDNDLNTFMKIVGATGDTFDRAFYDENKTVMETIRTRWDVWNGDDNIVSKKDLEKIRDSKDSSDAEKEAARFLLDNTGFFNMLDTAQKAAKGGDTKISDEDLLTWLQAIGVEKLQKKDLVYEEGTYDPSQADPNNNIIPN